MELVEIEILNWEKFNPRKDLKTTTWLRLNNAFFDDPDFFDFTDGELLVWVYILTIASKKQTGFITLNVSHAERVGRRKQRDVDSALKKLEHLGCVRARYADVTSTSRERHTTNGTNERNGTNVTKHHNEFDFESLYGKYPRKLGKQSGLQKANRDIQSPEDFELLKQAIDRFIEYHKSKGTEAKFIPHFSTFMTSWRDWIDSETGVENGFDKVKKFRGIAEILAEDENASA